MPILKSALIVLCVASVGGHASCAASPTEEQRRVPNEVRAADYGAKWPLTIDRAVLSCNVVAGRPMATVKTFDGREFALNGAAKGRGGFPPIEPVWKTQTLGTPKAIATRIPEPDRRRVFAAMAKCEDDARIAAEKETSDIRKQIDRERALATQCKTTMQKREKITAAEADLVSSEGVLLSWAPLQPVRVNISPLLDAALKLCK